MASTRSEEAVDVVPRDLDALVADERGYDEAVLASPTSTASAVGTRSPSRRSWGCSRDESCGCTKSAAKSAVTASGDGRGSGWLAFASRRAQLFGDVTPRELWEPFEAMWGLGCPIVGARVAALAVALTEVLRRDAPQATVLCCGLRQGSERLTRLAEALSGSHRLLLGSPTVRVAASLAGGMEAFMERRSARFRANLRRALREADRSAILHVRFVPTEADVAALYARAVAIDDRSWKGRSDAGLRATGLHDFYAEMLPRLARLGSLRMHFLVDGTHGTDLAYLFGGLSGDTFRGLQFAFASGQEARSLGNVIQARALAALCDEGIARYDLGTLVDYKRHWGELSDETLSLIAVPRQPRSAR